MAFSFIRHKVELVGGIGPTAGKVMLLDMIDISIGCRIYEVFSLPSALPDFKPKRTNYDSLKYETCNY